MHYQKPTILSLLDAQSGELSLSNIEDIKKAITSLKYFCLDEEIIQLL